MAMQVSIRNKCIFIHVPKVAGMAIEQSLIFDDMRSIAGTPVGGHVGALALRDIIGERWDEFFSFAFIRNPLDRFASAYTYLSKGGTNPVDEYIRDTFIAPAGGSFPKFIEQVEKNHLQYKIMHLVHQWKFVCEDGGNVIVDFIGRYENLEADFAYVCDRIGIPRFELPRVNASGVSSYQDLYDDATTEAVARLYAEDIALFGLPARCSAALS